MSGLRQELLAQLARFDDEAFAALASRGLLRRAYKDLASAAPRILQEDETQLLVDCGAQLVSFESRGLAFARCSCPASGVCQHILAAGLGLRGALTDALIPAAAAVTAAHGDGAMVDSHGVTVEGGWSPLRQALLGLSAAELLKHAGKAGYRWAWQFVQDLPPEQGLHLGGEHHLVITLGQPPLTLRYMGGPLQGMLVEHCRGAKEKYQVAGVLALQLAAGQQPPAPEARAGRGEQSPAAREASRGRLREQTRQLLQTCVAVGLAHVSPALQQRYVTLAVWAQGAEYPRLALSLRRLADQQQWLLDRTAGADTRRFFEELSRCYGLLQALDTAASRGEEPLHLTGQARTHYAPSAALELWGLGASAWRSASGYQGLTLMFWSPAQQAFFSASEIRAPQQRGFDPMLRYAAPGPWTGLASPAHASGQRLSLSGAQINAQGRLSLAESVAAVVLEPLSASLLAQLPAARDWQQLHMAHAARRRSVLTPAQPMQDWSVLAPAGAGEAYFDGIRQALVWPLEDQEQRRLDIELAYSPYNRHAIARIEALARQPWVDGTRLVVQLAERDGALLAQPLSVIKPISDPADKRVDALHFDPAPDEHDLLHSATRTGAAQMPRSPCASTRMLEEFADWLWQQAERGAGTGLDGPLLRWGAQLRAAGYSAIERTAPSTEISVRLIIAYYLCLQYRHLSE